MAKQSKSTPGKAALQAAEASLRALAPAKAAAIKQSWAMAMAVEGGFAADFYAQLFTLAPQVVSLFPGDMTDQQERLTHSLGDCVALVDDPDALLLLLRASGARHQYYGTEHGHFAVMRQALLATLAARLDGEFDAEMEQAWGELFDAMAIVMRGAMANKGVQG